MSRKINIKFVKTHPEAKLPARKYDIEGVGDSGYDIYAVEDVHIPPNQTIKVPVGLEIAYIEPGYWIRIESRSGLYFKHGITVFNGVIDNGYRGELGISMIDNGNSNGYTVKAGDRIAQLVVYKLIDCDISWSDSKDSTVRGENGFGHSGR